VAGPVVAATAMLPLVRGLDAWMGGDALMEEGGWKERQIYRFTGSTLDTNGVPGLSCAALRTRCRLSLIAFCAFSVPQPMKSVRQLKLIQTV